MPARALLALPLLPALLLVTPQSPSPVWNLQNSGTNASLRGVSAVSAEIAWISGSRGTVRRTSDGGLTWQPRPVPDAAMLDFRDVDAVDASTAWILSIGNGPASRIYRTTDAGASWTLQFQNDDPKAFYDAMAFADASHGVAVSDSVDAAFVVRMTTDGGASWPRVPPDRLPAALPNEGYFAASGTNVAMLDPDHIWLGTGAASRARVVRSTDAGATWQVSDTPLAAGETAGIYSIAFKNATTGLVVGGDYRKEADATDNIAITQDGGATWTLVRNGEGKSALSGFRSVVAWLPGTSTVVAVGPSGADISYDDGRTWQSITGPGFHTFSAVPGRRMGWAAGSLGRVAVLSVGDGTRPRR